MSFINTVVSVLGRKKSDIPPNPSRRGPDSIAQNSPSGYIPRNILAFRTITKLLSMIQKEPGLPVEDVKLKGNVQRLQLKLTSAFSTLAVIEHEIVAVAHSIDSETLGLIACVPSNDQNPVSSEPLSSRFWLKFCVTQNFRHSDREPTDPVLPEPTIIKAEVLANLGLVGDQAIKQYADECWSNQTVASHLWITSKLLGMKGPDNKKDSNDIFFRLLTHVVATCFPKMLRRLGPRSGSQHFINSLRAVTAFEFNEKLRGAPLEEHITNDQLFMNQFLLHVEDGVLLNKFPILIKQAQTAQLAVDEEEKEKNARLYTEESYMEFHRMLLYLIEAFTASLTALHDIRPPVPPKRRTALPTAATGDFKQQVKKAMLYGYAIQRLAHGAALKMHLKTIESQLRYYNASHPREPQPQKPGKEEEEELDEDVAAVCQSVSDGGVTTSLIDSYINWFRLLVAHFDAVDILIRFVTGPHFQSPTISVNILVAPPVDQTLLPWRELLADSTLLPTDASDKVSNADILEFLDGVLETLPNIKKAIRTCKAKDIPGTIKCLEALADSDVGLASWKKCANEMLVKLRSVPEPSFDETSAKLQSLSESAAFFNALSLFDGRFSGTLHCEAYLASLLAGFVGGEEISAQMQVG
ncbi:hypothetical protein NLJ89_g341 [Agrocybe chaxingu]|uniref:Uncharacterized protein n=1 Tax=Agrocybe chaxingu TaxID=84603 RepID=A0A9W8TF29_9AGAR|nr:hypothetical protein NLJ89_g341 [Agrocybe chaxingu]